MNITLDPYLEKIVQDKVESGVYQNASELVTEAIRLLVERDQTPIRPSIEELTQVGLDQIEGGEGREFSAELWHLAIERGKLMSRLGEPTPWYISGEID